MCRKPHGEHERSEHTVFLHDDRSERVPGARCRITLNGRPVEGATSADGAGAVTMELPHTAASLLIEWAPSHLPKGPEFPYRKVYVLQLSPEPEMGTRQRLQHIGVSRAGSLREQITSFQRAYGLPVDGELGSVIGPLIAFHDTASLPALGERDDQGNRPPPRVVPPDLRPPSQGCVSAVVDRDADCHLSFALVDEERHPVAGQSYVVEVGEGRFFEGVTDGEGKLEYGDVPGGDYLLSVADHQMYVPALEKRERWRPLLLRRDATGRGRG